MQCGYLQLKWNLSLDSKMQNLNHQREKRVQKCEWEKRPATGQLIHLTVYNTADD